MTAAAVYSVRYEPLRSSLRAEPPMRSLGPVLHGPMLPCPTCLLMPLLLFHIRVMHHPELINVADNRSPGRFLGSGLCLYRCVPRLINVCDFTHVVLRFGDRGDASIALHGVLTGVVSRQ